MFQGLVSRGSLGTPKNMHICGQSQAPLLPFSKVEMLDVYCKIWLIFLAMLGREMYHPRIAEVVLEDGFSKEYNIFPAEK